MLQAFKGARKNMREKIIELAKKCDADIVGFAPASRFDKNDVIFKIFPNTKTER